MRLVCQVAFNVPCVLCDIAPAKSFICKRRVHTQWHVHQRVRIQNRTHTHNSCDPFCETCAATPVEFRPGFIFDANMVRPSTPEIYGLLASSANTQAKEARSHSSML